MSNEAFAFAKAQAISSSPQKLLYLLLAERMSNETGTCFPGQTLLAEEATMCERAVRGHLKALELSGYIERTKRFRQDGTPTSDEFSFPGFLEWLTEMKADARSYHERYAKSEAVGNRRKPTTGRNLPPVDLGSHHRQVCVVTTGRNLPPNLKKNPKENPQSIAFHGNGSEEPKVQQPETSLPAKQKAKATKGSAEFEAAWNAYKAASGRSPGSKPQALAKFEALTAADKKLVVLAIEKYRAYGDPRYMVDMHRFFKDFFRQFADPAEVEAEQEETQVKAVALDLQKGEAKYSLQWWPGLQSIPERVIQSARSFMAEQGWEPLPSY